MENADNKINWHKLAIKYAQPNNLINIWQIINSLVPYILLWSLMLSYFDKLSYWIILSISLLTSGFLVRLFIIFHDCGHGSYFKNNTLNRIVGIFMGFASFTPYHKWSFEHSVHHKTVGNLDKKGIGDVITYTLDEYKIASTSKKILYRLIRNPLFLFFIGAFFNFIILNKIPKKFVSKRFNSYAVLTFIVEITYLVAMSFLFGFKRFILIQIPVLYFASMFGMFLFYVQHQYRDVVWERNENWDYFNVAKNGSSYLYLPKILKFFSGNIGFHHIHHISPKIPNYNLEKCMLENPQFQKKPLTFWQSIKDMNLNIWDEQNHKLIRFRDLK